MNPLKLNKRIIPQGIGRIVLIYSSAILGTIAFIIAFYFLFVPEVFFNGYIKGKIETAFMKGYPGYKMKIGAFHYNFWQSQMETDTICFTNDNPDMNDKIMGCKITGIKFKHLIGGGIKGNDFSGFIIDAKNIAISIPDSKYDLFISNVHLSASDSLMYAEDLEYHMRIDNEKIFSASNYRQTIFKISVPKIELHGADCGGLISGKNLYIRSSTLTDPTMEVLINKDKPFKQDTGFSPMPNEIYNKVTKPLRMDSVMIVNGHLDYNERYDVAGKFANLNFKSINITTHGSIHNTEKLVDEIIHVNCIFNNATPLNIKMKLHLTSQDFSLKYSGTFGAMDLTSLDHYLDIAEPMRIKSGMVESMAFDVEINSGNASGTVNAIYKDLKIESTNLKKWQLITRRKVTSRIANRFMIHKNNLPDKHGNVKQGIVKFTRKRDTAFTEMIWLSVRSGIEEITGL